MKTNYFSHLYICLEPKKDDEFAKKALDNVGKGLKIICKTLHFSV